MPAVTATAPGKVILLGEHSVVYGRPAIAAPVQQLHARAVISAAPLRPTGEVIVQAPDLDLEAYLRDLDDNHPLARAIQLTGASVGVSHIPACTIRISSTIPIAAGLGSGAAVTVALIRALSSFLGKPLPDSKVSELAFEVDKLHHGTPSGIDNTTITYSSLVYFERGKEIQRMHLPVGFTLLIADTGIQSPTTFAVGDLRRAWQQDTYRYEGIFDSIAELVRKARQLLESGKPDDIGPLMNKNHEYLIELGVSSPELDLLVNTAHQSGALGAKLSGGGRGGNMIALVEQNSASQISDALSRAGAIRTICSRIAGNGRKLDD